MEDTVVEVLTKEIENLKADMRLLQAAISVMLKEHHNNEYVITMSQILALADGKHSFSGVNNLHDEAGTLNLKLRKITGEAQSAD